MDIYVVDTSALLRDSDLLDKLNQGTIVIHTVVLEELAKLSEKNNSKGAYARKVGDRLFEIKNRGDFLKGIKVNNKVIKFDDTKPNTEAFLRFGLDPKIMDNLLLCVAKEIKESTGQRVVLLTGDKYFLLKAGIDVAVEYVKPNTSFKKKPKNKGYYNKGQQVAKRA